MSMAFHTDAKNTILEKIKANKIRMKSKAHFVGKTALLSLVALFMLIASSFLLSFIFFGLRVSGELELLGFGFKGIEIFLLLFPWGLLFLDILFFLVFEWLLRHFEFGYRRPFIYLAIWLFAIVFGASYAISATSFHSALLKRAQERRLPMIGSFYQRLHSPHKERGMYKGMVVSANSESFLLETFPSDDRKKIVEILFSEKVSRSIVQPGDAVIVVGIREGDGIRALGIKKIILQDGVQH